ncbi:hypothetical protein ONV78_24230 [Hahella sp. CR1]|uniref:hypothetical protein n=1 Tax=Hahella sp. CR1 TaxID=2992807 RepID=UPI002442E891|nr:hypothetical protein [Hahella sp. CR1]MDG9670869.1 hypothetical protein [Hahella sp. CR1]
MLEGLLALFSSSGLGALVGMFGSWLTKREERKDQQFRLTYELKMATLRKQEAELQYNHELALADKQILRADTEGRINRDIAETAAFKDGLKEQSQTYGMWFVDAIRGLMRPLITVYLLVLATFVTLNISSHLGGVGALSPVELMILYKEAIAQMLFLTTTAVTWWFGSRPSSIRGKAL